MSFENLSGQMLGSYELRELLGQGGMGAVYRAMQANLKRDVAIKILPTSLAQQSGYLERFNREAEIAAALQHPHIVPIIDYGMQRGISYVVMRYLSGGSLSQRINQRLSDNAPLPSLGEAAHILNQLGSALDYAHSQGVIHRDIKTSNIMFDNQGNAYIVDFGIAKLQGANQNLTSTGVTLGTSAYMPPEQWQSKALTPAADQYAMAIVMYVLLTGRIPYESDTPGGLMYKHFNEMPIPPQQFRADIPAGVGEVINRALAKQPEDRYPNMMAFANAFQKATAGHEGEPNGFFTFKIRGIPLPAPITPPSPPLSPPSGLATVHLTPPDAKSSDHVATEVQPTPPPIPPLKPLAPPSGNNNRVYWGLGSIIVIIVAVAFLVFNRQAGAPSISTATETGTSVAVVSSATIVTPPTSVVTAPSITDTIQPSPMIATATPTPSLTDTVTASRTSTATASATATKTSTATFTVTSSATSTATFTPSYTPTASQTFTRTPISVAIHTFSANTYSSTADSSIQLTWETVSQQTRIEELNSNYILIQSHDVPASGSLTVKIPKDTKDFVLYRLVATSGSEVRRNLFAVYVHVSTSTATLQPTPSIHTFSANTYSSAADGSIQLTWDTVSEQTRIEELNSNYILIQSHDVPASGSLTVKIPKDTKDFVLYRLVASSGSEVRRNLFAVYVRANTPTPRPSVTPKPPPDSVRYEFDTLPSGSGWSGTENANGTTFIWMVNTKATLRFIINTQHDLRLRMRVVDYKRSEILHSLTMKVNGQTWPFSQRGSDVPALFTATIPKGVLAANPGVVQLEFDISEVILASNTDSRKLGLAFDWIELTPVSSPAATPISATANASLPGRIVFTSDRNASPEIFYMNPSKPLIPQRLTVDPSVDGHPVLSPDGRWIAFTSNREGNFKIYDMPVNGMFQTPVTDDATNNSNPSWSPDGKRIVYSSLKNGTSQLFWVDVGQDTPHLVSPSSNFNDFNPDWSPDGLNFAFETDRFGNRDIYVIGINGLGLNNVAAAISFDGDPAWSPDGKQIAFTSNRDGNFEIYVMNAGGGNRRRLTVNDARDEQPTWSPDGQYIAFVSDRSGNKDIWVMKTNDGSMVTNLTADSKAADYDPNWGIEPNTNVAITPNATPTPILTTLIAIAIVKVPSANLRSGPGINYSFVAAVEKGAKFTIIAQAYNNQWYLIDSGLGKRAWVSASVVAVLNNQAVIPAAATIPAAPAG